MLLLVPRVPSTVVPAMSVDLVAVAPGFIAVSLARGGGVVGALVVPTVTIFALRLRFGTIPLLIALLSL